MFNFISRTLVGGESHPSAAIQSVYSTVPADYAKRNLFFFVCFCDCFNYFLLDMFFSFAAFFGRSGWVKKILVSLSREE